MGNLEKRNGVNGDAQCAGHRRTGDGSYGWNTRCRRTGEQTSRASDSTSGSSQGGLHGHEEPQTLSRWGCGRQKTRLSLEIKELAQREDTVEGHFYVTAGQKK